MRVYAFYRIMTKSHPAWTAGKVTTFHCEGLFYNELSFLRMLDKWNHNNGSWHYYSDAGRPFREATRDEIKKGPEGISWAIPERTQEPAAA